MEIMFMYDFGKNKSVLADTGFTKVIDINTGPISVVIP
jgi:hypothetical protein